MVKVVLLKDGHRIASSIQTTGLEEKAGITAALGEALLTAGIKKEDLNRVISTGIGANLVEEADGQTSSNIADARGMCVLDPSVKTIIDVGAEEGRVIQVENGRVTSYVINDRCAAGAGSFVDAMARVLEVTVEQFGEMALLAKNSSQISAQCTVFAESEVISMVASDKTPEDIARSVVDAIAERTNAMAMRLKVEPDIAFIGGAARNIGIVHSLQKALGVERLHIPDDPEFVGALGAAIIATDAPGHRGDN